MSVIQFRHPNFIDEQQHVAQVGGHPTGESVTRFAIGLVQAGIVLKADRAACPCGKHGGAL
jgi:hypothetical protein